MLCATAQSDEVSSQTIGNANRSKVPSEYFSLQNNLHDLYCISHRRPKLMLFDEFNFGAEEPIVALTSKFIHILEKKNCQLHCLVMDITR
jgi:hypothetical protein